MAVGPDVPELRNGAPGAPEAPEAGREPARVADRLRDEILRGAWGPGERLPGERDLARRLEVGRAAVREALRTLEQLGLVRIRRGGGATVCELHEASLDVVQYLLFASGRLDLDLALQVLDVHEMLVAGAARLSVERGGEEDLLRARDLLARLRRPGLESSVRLEILDGLFELMTRASGNLVLRLCRRALQPRRLREAGRLPWEALRPPDDELERQVRAIEESIAARDPAATEEAVRALLRDRRARLVELLDLIDDPDFRRRAAPPRAR